MKDAHAYAADLEDLTPAGIACGIRDLAEVKELIKSLHTNAWFAVNGTSHVVVTSTGGRQGCKHGGTVFCAAYEEAFARVHSRLRERGIALTFTTASLSSFMSSLSARDARDGSGNGVLFSKYCNDGEFTCCGSRPISSGPGHMGE